VVYRTARVVQGRYLKDTPRLKEIIKKTQVQGRAKDISGKAQEEAVNPVGNKEHRAKGPAKRVGKTQKKRNYS
jgi:uncharacterized protein YjbJ (UPF0337 family)